MLPDPCPSCRRPAASHPSVARAKATSVLSVRREDVIAALEFGSTQANGASFSKAQIDAILIQLNASEAKRKMASERLRAIEAGEARKPSRWGDLAAYAGTALASLAVAVALHAVGLL